MSAVSERVTVSRVAHLPSASVEEPNSADALEDDVSSSSEDWTQWEFVDVGASTGKVRTPIFASVERTLSDSLVKVDMESSQLRDNLDEEKAHTEDIDLHAQYLKQQREMAKKRGQLGVAWQMYQSTYGQITDDSPDSNDDELAALEDATAEATAELEAVKDEKDKARRELDKLKAELAEMEQKAAEMAAAAALAKTERTEITERELKKQSRAEADEPSALLSSAVSISDWKDAHLESVTSIPSATVVSSLEESVRPEQSRDEILSDQKIDDETDEVALLTAEVEESSAVEAPPSAVLSTSVESTSPRMWDRKDWKSLFKFTDYINGSTITMKSGESKDCGWALSKNRSKQSGALELCLMLECVKQSHTFMMDGMSGSILEKDIPMEKKKNGMIVKDEGKITYYSLSKDENELYIVTTVTAPQTPGQYCGTFRLVLSSSDGIQVGPKLKLTILVKSEYGAKRERKIQRLLSVYSLDCEEHRDQVIAALVGQKWDVEAAAEVLGSSLLPG